MNAGRSRAGGRGTKTGKPSRKAKPSSTRVIRTFATPALFLDPKPQLLEAQWIHMDFLVV